MIYKNLWICFFRTRLIQDNNLRQGYRILGLLEPKIHDSYFRKNTKAMEKKKGRKGLRLKMDGTFFLRVKICVNTF